MASRPHAASEGIAARSGKFLRAQLSWLLIPALSLVLIVAGWIVLIEHLGLEERRMLDAATRDIESFVIAYEQYTLRTIKEADRTALMIKESYERDGRIDIAGMVARGVIPQEALIQINVADSAGDVTTSTLPYQGTRNMADREYFRLHATSNTGKLDIAKPIIGRISGRLSIPLSRRLNKSDGSFGGIVVLQISPQHFTTFYRETELKRRGLVAIVGLDGYFRARRSGNTRFETPLDAADPSFIEKARGTPEGWFETISKIDSVSRLGAYRVLQDYPLMVTAAIARDEALAEYNERRSTYFDIAVLASIAVFAFFTLVALLAMRLQRSHRRLWQTRETLRAASDSSLDAFFLLRTLRDERGAVMDFWLREVNARGAELIGRERQAALGERLSSLPTPLTGGAIDKYVRVLESGNPLDEELEWHRGEAITRCFRCQVVRVHDGLAMTVRDITERKRTLREVQVQKGFLQALVDNIPVGVVMRSLKPEDGGAIILMNDRCPFVNADAARDAIGRKLSDIVPAGTAARMLAMDEAMRKHPSTQEIFDLTLETPQFGQRVLHLIRAPVLGEGGAADYVVSILRDITDEQATIGKLRLASKVFETSLDAIVVTDADDRVIAVNSAFTTLTQLTADEVVGHVLAESPFRPIDPVESAARMEQQRREGYICCEVTRFRKDSKKLTLWLTATCVYDESGAIVNYVRVFTDVSVLKESEEKLKQLANFDTLTGLPNRRLFHDRLDQAIQRAARCDYRMGLLFLDLDGFKEVNDTLGHDVGDRLLQETTERLQDCLRGSDSLCRLGGDEFTIIVENATLPADAVRVAERIVAVLGEPFLLAGHNIRTTASIGIAIYPDDGANSTTLIRNADVAMYRAKKSGRNGYVLFGVRAGVRPLRLASPEPEGDAIAR